MQISTVALAFFLLLAVVLVHDAWGQEPIPPKGGKGKAGGGGGKGGGGKAGGGGGKAGKMGGGGGGPEMGGKDAKAPAKAEAKASAAGPPAEAKAGAKADPKAGGGKGKAGAKEGGGKGEMGAKAGGGKGNKAGVKAGGGKAKAKAEAKGKAGGGKGEAGAKAGAKAQPEAKAGGGGKAKAGGGGGGGKVQGKEARFIPNKMQESVQYSETGSAGGEQGGKGNVDLGGGEAQGGDEEDSENWPHISQDQKYYPGLMGPLMAGQSAKAGMFGAFGAGGSLNGIMMNGQGKNNPRTRPAQRGAAAAGVGAMGGSAQLGKGMKMSARIKEAVEKFFIHFKMAFLTLFHTLKGTQKVVTDIGAYIVIAERYHEVTVQWLKNFVDQINNG